MSCIFPQSSVCGGDTWCVCVCVFLWQFILLTLLTMVRRTHYCYGSGWGGQHAMVRLWDTRNHFIHDQEAKQEKERGKCPLPSEDVCLGWEDFSIVKKVLKLSNHLPTAPNQWPNIQHRHVFRGIWLPVTSNRLFLGTSLWRAVLGRLALPFGPTQVASGETDSCRPAHRIHVPYVWSTQIATGGVSQVSMQIYFGGSTFSRRQSYLGPYGIGRGVFLYKFIFSVVQCLFLWACEWGCTWRQTWHLRLPPSLLPFLSEADPIIDHRALAFS